MALYIIMLVVFFAVFIGVGIYSRRHASDVNGFVLGGRSVGPWLTAFAFGTSYFSAVVFVGYAGQFGWLFGVPATWAGLGNAFIGSLLAWAVLGRRTRIMTQHLDSRTMPDFFGLRFDSSLLKIVASVITFVFLIPYTASLFNGLSRLFDMAFPGVDYAWCVIVMAILTAIYVIVGGYMATAINDFIQGIIMLLGISTVIGVVLHNNGGFIQALTDLSQIQAPGTEMKGAYISFFGPDPLFLLFVVILTSLGTWGLPQMASKFYAIKDEDAIHKGTVISTLFAIVVSGGCYFLGGFGHLYADKITYNPATGKPVFDSIIPTMLENLPTILIGVVLVLVLSASMSTLSSLVLTSSSTITLDLINPLRKGGMTEKKKMLTMRIFIAFFIIISAIIAIYQSRSSVIFIAQLMGVSWGALAGAFLAPYLYGLYWKGTTKGACWVSFIFGVTLSVVQLTKSLSGFNFGVDFLDNVFFKSSIHSGSFAMLIGLVLVPLVSVCTKKMKKEQVDHIFECYNKKVTVPISDALGKKAE